MTEPGTEDLALIVDTLEIPEESAAEALRMHQRPRITELDEGLAMLVMYGMAERGHSTVELHAVISDRFVLTVHDGPRRG